MPGHTEGHLAFAAEGCVFSGDVLFAGGVGRVDLLTGCVHGANIALISFLPILLIGILFGLAMDYQLFLVSGMREAFVHGRSARAAVQEGLQAGQAVVTAAAIITPTPDPFTMFLLAGPHTRSSAPPAGARDGITRPP